MEVLFQHLICWSVLNKKQKTSFDYREYSSEEETEDDRDDPEESKTAQETLEDDDDFQEEEDEGVYTMEMAEENQEEFSDSQEEKEDREMEEASGLGLVKRQGVMEEQDLGYMSHDKPPAGVVM